jgi:hypothetical protein
MREVFQPGGRIAAWSRFSKEKSQSNQRAQRGSGVNLAFCYPHIPVMREHALRMNAGKAGSRMARETSSGEAGTIAALKREAAAFAARQLELRWPPHTVPAAIALITGYRIEDETDLRDPAKAAPVIARLRRDLVREKRKSRRGHGGYNFGRHVTLHQLLKRVLSIGDQGEP